MTRAKPTSRFLLLGALSGVAAICAYALFALPAGRAAQTELAPNALWEIVHNICVPGQTQYGNPAPCLRVNLDGGEKKGFAILEDPKKINQFLVVPTARIAGIESPALREPDSPNYFASAWEARTYVNDALHRTLPRDYIGMAVNSVASRTQDQLHIHVACARADVVEALHENQTSIGAQWAPFQAHPGHPYMAMWVPGENLGASNPFRLLAEQTEARLDMGSHALIVVGLTRSDGTKGFVLIADQVNGASDRANGEDLLDHMCRIATDGLKN